MSIRILLIDDHALFRGGIRALLTQQPDFEVVDDAADGVEGVKRAKQHRPDVVLLDLNMPGLSGLETLHLLVQDAPSAAVIMLTVSEDAEELAAALQAGARGFLLKNIETDALISAIRRAAAGEPVIAERMAAKLVTRFLAPRPPTTATSPLPPVTPSSPPVTPRNSVPTARLTPRERDIVRGLIRGHSNKEIARELGVTESTVKIHVQSVLKKLHLSSRVQIAVYAVEHGLG